jgi:hypothetical protein
MELGLDDNDAKDLAQGLGDTKPSAQASSSKPLSVDKSNKGRKPSGAQQVSKPAEAAKPQGAVLKNAEAAETVNQAEEPPAP